MKVQEQKYQEGPRDVMVLRPDGADPYMSKTFVTGQVLYVCGGTTLGVAPI